MPKYKEFKEQVFRAIDDTYGENRLNKYIDFFTSALILFNLLAIILESFQSLHDKYSFYFYKFEELSVILFTAEYILRIWTAELKAPSQNPFYSKIRYIFSITGIIDILAILPFYIPFLIPDLRFIRVLRLTKMLRVLKLTRYSKALKIVFKVLKDKSDELLATVMITVILLVVSSTLIYYIERDAQPDKFTDIISSLWWSVATLTTIGYGDVYPITILGKILSCIIAVLGIGLVALPTGIISSGFLEEIRREKNVDKKPESIECCPHCGKKIEH